MHRKFYFKWFVITSVILLCVAGLTQCIEGKQHQAEETKRLVEFEEFAGSAQCASCHGDIYNTHLKTGHFQTSSAATKTNIKGSFDTDKNTYTYANGSAIKMEAIDSNLYQVAYLNGVRSTFQSIDMVVGSGAKGQSYATWNKDRLFQLPITYFTQTQQWCNSPGYPNRIAFNRPITARCLECHTTYAEENNSTKSNGGNFIKGKFIYGVSCEKCHGPGADHVKYHNSYPNEKSAKFIVNPSSFSRTQSLDLCALCHGGKLEKTKPSFSYTAGSNLSDYFTWDTSVVAAEAIDVHGNQLGLLRLSKCFVKSTTLTCNSCHKPHETTPLPIFSQQCLNCHSTEHDNFCTEKTVSPAVKKSNCIDCHMPKQASRSIAVFLPGQTSITPTFIRTHLIAKYVDETKKYIEGLEDKKADK